MTADPRPSTEAGRALLDATYAPDVTSMPGFLWLARERLIESILAIEAEARLATPGSDVLDAVREALRHPPDEVYTVNERMYGWERAKQRLEDRLARLATAGPDAPHDHWEASVGEDGFCDQCRPAPEAAGPSEREAARARLLDDLYEAVGASPATNRGTPRERAVYAAWRAIADHDEGAKP